MNIKKEINASQSDYSYFSLHILFLQKRKICMSSHLASKCRYVGDARMEFNMSYTWRPMVYSIFSSLGMTCHGKRLTHLVEKGIKVAPWLGSCFDSSGMLDDNPMHLVTLDCL